MRRTRTLALVALLCALVPALVFAGGKTEESTGPATGAGQKVTTEEATKAAATTAAGTATTSLKVKELTNLHTLPLVKDKVTITMAGRGADAAVAAGFNSFWNIKEIEKRTNIKVDYQGVVGDPQYTQAIVARIAAGDIPDLFAVRGNFLEYVEAGLLAKLNPVIEQYQPNIKSLFQRRPDLVGLNTMPDGFMYSVRVPIPDNAYIIPLIRGDWLEKSGLARPVTLADWEKLLRYFRDNDMNGNGDPNDELGMVCWDSLSLSNYFAQSWGLPTFYSGGWGTDKNGKVFYSYTDPRYKEVLAWFNKLYREKLVDNALYSDAATDRPAANKWGDNARGKGGVTVNWNFAPGPNGAWSALLKDIPGAFWTWAKPAKGPVGEPFVEAYGPIAGDHWSINAKTKNMEAVAKYMDFIYASKEGHLLTWYGMEGQTYKLVDGGPEWIPGWREGQIAELKASGGEVVSKDMLMTWWADGIGIQTEDWYYQNNFKKEPLTVEATNNTIGFLKPKFPAVPLLKAENDQLAKYPDIGGYVREMTIKFISGVEPIENFDVFVNQLKKLGVDEVVKVRQAQYDRYVKATGK